MLLSAAMTDTAEHEALARLHGATNPSRMGKVMFDLVSARIPHELLFIAFLPIKFELPSLCSEQKYKVYCDAYIRDTNKYDIWLRRSPVGPSVKTVRHSDHTPQSILKRSLFYREVMTPANLEYGASLVAWHGDQWLATLTVFRNARQGDLSDDEMAQLAKWQIHFEAMVQRLAIAKEERLEEDSVSNFIWSLPTSTCFVKWDMTPSHFTASAVELSNVWRKGLSMLALKGLPSRITVPKDLLETLSRLKPRIESAKLARPGPLRAVALETVEHPRIRGLVAKIYFIPSKSLTLSRGRFMIEFHLDQPSAPPKLPSTYLSVLSRSERKVAVEAAKGLSNEEIAQVLRKSKGTVKVQMAQVYKKMKLKSRAQLASILSRATNSTFSPATGNETIQVLD